MTIFGVFGLASCGKNEIDYTLDESSKGTKIYESWLKDVKFSSEKIAMEGDNYGPKATRYEIFLPEDIKASSKYVTQSIEAAYNDNNKQVSFAYWSLFTLGNASMEVCNQVSTIYESKIKAAYAGTNITPENYTKGWITSVNIKGDNALEFVEGKERGLSILYMPIRVMFYLAKENADAQPKVETYALVPVYYELGYLVDGKPETNSFEGFEKVDLMLDSNGNFEKVEK